MLICYISYLQTSENIFVFYFLCEINWILSVQFYAQDLCTLVTKGRSGVDFQPGTLPTGLKMETHESGPRGRKEGGIALWFVTSRDVKLLRKKNKLKQSKTKLWFTTKLFSGKPNTESSRRQRDNTSLKTLRRFCQQPKHPHAPPKGRIWFCLLLAVSSPG